jgi:hypothetical protein
MLDRWIPDEDWVRQMRIDCESDCSVVNLNSGLSKQCVWQNNHAILQGTTKFSLTRRKSKSPRPKQPKKRLASTMLYQLVSQLPPFQATKASTNLYGTTQIGATVHSSGQHHKPRKLQAFSPPKPRNPKRPLWQELCRHIQAHCSNHRQSHSKRPAEWFKRLGRGRFQASDSLSR